MSSLWERILRSNTTYGEAILGDKMTSRKLISLYVEGSRKEAIKAANKYGIPVVASTYGDKIENGYELFSGAVLLSPVSSEDQRLKHWQEFGTLFDWDDGGDFRPNV